MANKKKETPFMSGEDINAEIARRLNFAKKDVKEIMDEFKLLVEECICNGVDVDIKGLIHISIKEMNYKKAPGIVKYHGATKFKNVTRRIVYQVPKNFREIIKKNNKESA